MRGVRTRRRTGLVLRLAVLVLVLLLIGSAALAGPAELEKELEETQERLDAARTDLHGVSAEVEEAQGQLLQTEAELANAQHELAELETHLEAAVAAHDEAVTETNRANARLNLATIRLERTERRLENRIATFDARVAATYKYGGITYAQVVFESADFGDFLSSMQYVKSALDHDRDIIDEVTSLTRELAQRRAEVQELRNAAKAQEERAKEARDEVASLTTRQRTLTEQITEKKETQSVLLGELEEVQSEFQAQVDALEEDSAAVEAELQREYARLAGQGGWGGWVAGETPKAGSLAWPTNGRVTSGYGYRTHPIYGTKRMHTGVDIPAPTGQAVVAAADGVVISAGWRGGYGMAVVIDHGGGMATLYAHLSGFDVSAGQRVTKAQRVGSIGSTGMSTGPHLHFEVRIGGAAQDPQRWYR
jgi:murein DD-endopeptidase MepM/ murein hydrolase activator NlpD